MEIVFPKLSELPQGISSHLRKMIDCIANLDLSVKMTTHKEHVHIYEVYDSSKRLRYLFKKLCDYEEVSPRKEVDVYLLDHPKNSNKA
ncbi:unnamed protein product [Eruca vesicaria subsp. sativa]|uniref:Uncharacterized protein n=1 Tax=Eruca vesicaria subsp. sativa TaxID=29727 RepID=A0ABC8JX71_ERUVS|nr:unnamed protein product [Eruca vesicaria subsp. sativa]